MQEHQTTCSQNNCITEHVNPDDPDMICASLPQLIFEMDDIALIACGSLTCIRGIYLTAYRVNALNRFFYRIIDPSLYACGLAGEKIGELISDVLEKVRPGAVIYYASCMETLMRIDFDRIIDRIDNPRHIPIHVLYRGPMVNRYIDTRTELVSTLLKIPYSGKRIAVKGHLMPPVMPDFAAVTEMLQGMETYHFLVTPGGCDGCLTPLASRKRAYQLTKSRLDDIAIASGFEQSIETGIKDDYVREGKDWIAAISGTAVPRVTGFYYQHVQQSLQESGIQSVLFQTDAFHSACEGVSQAYLTLARIFCGEQDREMHPEAVNSQKEIGVLGAHPYAVADSLHLRHAFSTLKSLGYSAFVPEEHDLHEFCRLARTKMNWVVSTEGIPAAEYFKEHFGIPYLTCFPFGYEAVQEWKDLLNGSTADDGTRPWNGYRKEMQPGHEEKCLIICDPVLSYAIARYLVRVHGMTDVTRAVYSALQSETAWYEKTLHMAERLSSDSADGSNFSGLTFFSTEEELRGLVRKADLIIADRTLTDALGEEAILKRKTLIDLPDPIISAGLRPEPSSYEIFGSRGSEWLEQMMEVMDDEKAAIS